MFTLKVLRVSFACLVFPCLALSVAQAEYPAEKFDLRFWKVTLPTDRNKDGKPDEVDVQGLTKFSHPDFSYLDQGGFLVFSAPNKATTTANSTNTRSELRQMFRSKNTRIAVIYVPELSLWLPTLLN